jgi:hypothetical protein
VARRRNEGLVEQLAVGRAAGMTVSDWCARHGVPAGTARGWARLPEFPARVEAHRLALVGRELTILAERSASRLIAGEPPRAAALSA